MGRRDQRKSFSVPVRVSLLEDDNDESEELLKVIEGKLDRARNTLIGLLLTLLTSMVFVLIDIVIRS